ncbi:MAG: pyridoxamine 5'-phosphate oxidase family protein [Alphaproteobacteria bacterium]|nr:pyridoxamine 5'-phosphate oxidase family protein [Alphaproteobacteria bacterium]
MGDYVVTDRTRVRRVHQRGRYDRETVHAILDEGLICHLGFAVEGRPFVIPTAHWRDGERVYVHGSSASRTLRSLKAGVDVCLTVTLVDGLVMARSGFHHSMNYRCVMVFGRATLVDDPDEKMAALKTFLDKIAPGRWDEVRPPNDQEFKATTVLALPLEEVSAKVRTGPPVDDEEDYALPVWAGVVPLSLTQGSPEPDPRLAPGTPLPDYLAKP